MTGQTGRRNAIRTPPPLAWFGTGLAMVGVWLMVLGLTVPQAIHRGVGDYGFFTAVADRLRAGDILYADIWDNKDPLVFYAIAVARTFDATGAWALELGWVLIASVSLHFIARSNGLSDVLSAFLAFVTAPIVILGTPYFMGSTHLPAVALTLMATAFALRSHYARAGIVVGVLTFFKIVMLPLVLAAVAAAAVAQNERHRLIRFAVGAVAVVTGVSLALLLRGELIGFIDAQIDNILYSQAPIVSAEHTGLVRKIAQHVVIFINPSIAAMEIATVASLVVTAFVFRRRGADRHWSSLPVVWWVASVTFVVSTSIIAVTGKWFHHAEIYSVSSVLVLVVVATALTKILQWSGWITAATTLLLAYPLAGAPALSEYPDAIRELPGHWQAANNPDELTTLLQDHEPTSIAFVGMGNALPRSGGLGEWSLVCRHVGQRPFNPQHVFTETLDCLPNAELVVIGPDYGTDPAFPAYSEFVDGVEALMVKDFTCEQAGNFRLCSRNP